MKLLSYDDFSSAEYFDFPSPDGRDRAHRELYHAWSVEGGDSDSDDPDCSGWYRLMADGRPIHAIQLFPVARKDKSQAWFRAQDSHDFPQDASYADVVWLAQDLLSQVSEGVNVSISPILKSEIIPSIDRHLVSMIPKSNACVSMITCWPPGDIAPSYLNGQILLNGQLLRLPTTHGLFVWFECQLNDSIAAVDASTCSFQYEFNHPTLGDSLISGKSLESMYGSRWEDCESFLNSNTTSSGLLLSGPIGVGKGALLSQLTKKVSSRKLFVLDMVEMDSRRHTDSLSYKTQIDFIEQYSRLSGRHCIVQLKSVQTIFPKHADDRKVLMFKLIKKLRSSNKCILVGTTQDLSLVDQYGLRFLFSKQITLSSPSSSQRYEFLQSVLTNLPRSVVMSISEICNGHLLADFIGWLPRLIGMQSTAEEKLKFTESPDLTFKQLIQGTSVSLDRSPSSMEDRVPRHSLANSATIDADTERVTLELIPRHWKTSCRDPRALFGVVLHGPTGSGKTFLVRQLKQKLIDAVTFITLSIPELVRSEMGEAEKTLSQHFATARANAPSIIFVDEIDALFAGSVGSNTSSDTLSSLLSQFIMELDRILFNSELNADKIAVIVATNRLDSLHPSLTRCGRLDRRVHLASRKDNNVCRNMIAKMIDRILKDSSCASINFTVDRQHFIERLSELASHLSVAELDGMLRVAVLSALSRCKNDYFLAFEEVDFEH